MKGDVGMAWIIKKDTNKMSLNAPSYLHLYIFLDNIVVICVAI